MRLVDTHCHLDLDAFAQDRALVLERARSAGVDRFILIGFDPERWSTCAALASRTPGASLAVGLHPTEAEAFDADLESALRRTAVEMNAIAIGETGLDYYWKAETAEAQRRAFERQIALAKSLDLPFIVHQRNAASDVLGVLRAAGPPHRGVMHCFTDDRRYAESCLELGMHLGIGGAVTYKNAASLQEVVATMPIDRLLVETDSPYMTPVPNRGKRNEPAYLRHTVAAISALRDVLPEVVAEQSTRNAEALFRLRSVALDMGRI